MDMIPKFRAWDKLSKKMINFIVSVNYTYEYIIFDSEKSLDKKKSFKNIIFMPYTGLKDKHGIKIFKYDIVKPERGDAFVVKDFIFGQGVFKLALITDDGHSFDGIYPGGAVEVIGNIGEEIEVV